MRIHQNVIRVAPLPSLLPAPAAPPNITRWGLHGRSPDRSNVRRGRRGKAGKPENPNPHTRVKVRMRKAPRRNFGMKLESRRLSSTKIPGSADWPRRIAVVGSLLDPSHHRVCGIWHRSACLAMWIIGGGAFVQHKRMRQAAMILGGCRPAKAAAARPAQPRVRLCQIHVRAVSALLVARGGEFRLRLVLGLMPCSLSAAAPAIECAVVVVPVGDRVQQRAEQPPAATRAQAVKVKVPRQPRGSR